MQKSCVLVSGQSVSEDGNLLRALRRTALVLANSDNGKIMSALKTNKVDLLILEISNAKSGELDIIENIKERFGDIKIILIKWRSQPLWSGIYYWS